MRDVPADRLEQHLRAGRTLDGRALGLDLGPGDLPVIRAAALRRFLTDRADVVDPYGLRLANVHVVGDVVLEALTVPFPVAFTGCTFAKPLLLNGSTMHAVELVDCRLPALVANGLQLRRDLNLSGSTIRGGVTTSASTSKQAAVWLCEAEVGGRLIAQGTRVVATGHRAIQADGLRVRGAVRLFHGFEAVGEVRLLAAEIGGVLDLSGARFADLGQGWALTLGEATIGGSLLLITDPRGRCPAVQGYLDLEDARVGGQLLLVDATLRAPQHVVATYLDHLGDHVGKCVIAQRLHVDGAVVLSGETVLHGGADLSMCVASSVRLASTVRLEAPGQVALDLTRGTVRGELRLEPGVEVRGTLALSGAHVGRDLVLSRVRLSDPARQSLVRAPGITVDGIVDLSHAHVDGGSVRLVDATVASTVDLLGATLVHRGEDYDDASEGQTLTLRSARVKGSVRLSRGFSSTGQVVLTRAEIEGWLDCDGGTFTGGGATRENPHDDALTAVSAKFLRGMYLTWRSCGPGVDLTSTETTVVSDDPANAPPRLVLAGFVYDRFTRPRDRPDLDPWDPDGRLAWLDRQPSFDEGVYEQAARVFARHGRVYAAEAILIAQRERARRLLLEPAPADGAGLGRRWLQWSRRRAEAGASWTYGRLFGYGYRPLRALAAVLLLLATVAVALQVPAVAATLRATDSRGNVYVPTGRLLTVSVADVADAPPAGDPVRAASIRVEADPCGAGQVRCFDAALFAVDTVVPLVSLEQRTTWYPNPAAPWGRAVEYGLAAATVLGWLLSTTLVLSLARLARTLG